MKNVFSYFRIVFLGVMILSGVARATGRVDPADEIVEALQQACLWDEKEDEAAEKILAFFYGKALTYEKASGGENALLAATFYSLTAQTLWEYYRSYGAAEDFRTSIGVEAEPSVRHDFENTDAWTKQDFYRAIHTFLEKSCNLSLLERRPETLARFTPALRLWDSTLSCYAPDLTLALHYRALQIWREMGMDAGVGMEAGIGEAAARCRARLLAAGEREALCDWDLHYLRFLRDKDSIDHNEYIQRLLQLEQTCKDLPLASDILCILAENAQGLDAKQAEAYARRASAYTGSWGAHNGRILLHNLLSPALSLSMKRVQAPDFPVEVNFEAKNCRTFFYMLRRLSKQQVEDVLTEGFSERFANGMADGNLLWQRADLQPDSSGKGKSLLPPLKKGAYVLACRLDSSDSKNTSFLFFQVSDGAYFGYPADSRRQTWEMLLLAGKDGQPTPASLCVFSESYNYKKRRNDFEFRGRLKADRNGIFKLDGNLLKDKKAGEAFWVRFDRKDDTLWVENPLYMAAAEAEPAKTRAEKKKDGEIRFFPNLPAYRKGDSVHMAVWVSDTPSLVTFSLRDPERKTRLKMEGKLHNGLIRIDFALPEDGKAGLWTLCARDYAPCFSLFVEEYVRPTFEILWENVPLQAVRDSFHMEGKAAYLSGESLRQARVNYTVFKTAYSYARPFTIFGYRMPARQKSAEILLTKGTTQTDAEGRFSFRFAQDTALLNEAPFWVYEVVAEGVDAGGETQVARVEIPLRTVYSLHVEGNELWVSDHGKWIGNPRPFEVSMNGLNPGDTWELLDSTLLMPRHDWASGEHQLIFSALTPDGKTVYATKKIRVEKCGEEVTDFFLKADDVRLDKNGVLGVRFAMGNPLACSLLFRFRIEDAGGHFLSFEKLLPSGGGVWEIPCPGLDPESGWTLSAFALYDGKSVNEETTLTPPRPERKMDFTMRRAGSEANPPRAGQGDTLFFESPKGTAEGAEPQALIVSMYDQSLDAVSQIGALWPAVLLAPYPQAPASAWSGALCSDRSAWLFLHGPSHPDTYLDYPVLPANLKWSGLFRYRSQMLFSNTRIRGTGAKPRMTMAKNADATEESASEDNLNQDDTENLTVREDFSPGVFFALPEWQATDNGYKAVLPFTHPGYFGRFKIRAFGFDHRLFANYREQLVEVSNPLMLYPQTPRFLTVDDSAVLSCRFVMKTPGSLHMQLTATAVYQDGTRHRIASASYTQHTHEQGAFELPLRIEKRYTKIEFLCTAVLTFGQDSTQVSDRVKKEIPIEKGETELCEYYPFALLPAQKNELKPNFSFPCDSLHLTLNDPSQSLAATFLAEKEFDSCKTSLQTVEKMTSLCLTQKTWKPLWERLQEFSKPDGGYSWLPQGPASVDITLSVLETLSYIPETEFSTLRDRQRNIRKGMEFLARKFRISDTNTVQPSSLSMRFLNVLTRWKSEAVSPYVEKEKSLYSRAALQHLDRLPLEQRAILLSFLLSEKRYDEAREVLADLQRLALFDPVQGMYWKREALGNNPGRRMVTMSAIAEAVSYAASLEDFAPQATRDTLRLQYLQILTWFPAQKQSLDFSRPNGNGVGTRELLAWASASRSANTRPANAKPQVSQALDTIIPARQLNAFVSRLTASETATQAQSVRFGTLRACTTQKTRNVKAYKGNGDLAVSLTYAPPADGNTYCRGEIVEVAVEIKAKRDFNYVQLNIPRPAGLEWEDTRSGFTSRNKISFYKDVDVRNTDCFFEFLPKGTYRIFYRLKAQNAGEFTQAPASALSQNESAFGSRTSSILIKTTH